MGAANAVGLGTVRTEPELGPPRGFGPTTSVALDGEIDLDAVPRLHERVEAALRVGAPGDVVFDLTECTFLDSSGLQALFGEVRRVEAGGRAAKVVGARGVVLRVLQLTGSDVVLPLDD
jgi:anti-anti-sigma factor